MNKIMQPRAAIILPHKMSSRNFFEAGIFYRLASKSAFHFDILSHDEEDREKVEKLKSKNVSWFNIAALGKSFAAEAEKSNSFFSVSQCLHGLLSSCLHEILDYGQLVYRFNHLNGFQGHKQKTNLSPNRQAIETANGNYVEPRYGKPFVNSVWFYKLLYNIYYSSWCSEQDAGVNAYFKSRCPSLLILSYIQYKGVRKYYLAARKRNIPIIGIVGSWDQPTTKGPVCPNLSLYIVQNKLMKQELVKYHKIPESKVLISGWPQMDCYSDKTLIQSRANWSSQIGISVNNKVLLYGANCSRLGAHEPSVVQHIIRQIKSGRYKIPCSLIVRSHPWDEHWKERFGNLHEPPYVIVRAPEWNNLSDLLNQVYHSDIVFATSGTISLDAIAQDTCVVGVGFDGELELDYYESIARWFEQDHYAALVERKGLKVVESYKTLDEEIIRYLQNPSLDAEGRNKIREDILSPMDGAASERIVNAICSFLT